MSIQSDFLDESMRGLVITLSDNIKKFRKRKRMSQQDLADACGLHRTYISDLENAKCNPTLNVLMVLARNLDTDLMGLFQK